MSSPVITCPECNKKFKGKAELVGKKIRCPFCSEPFVVPAEEGEACARARAAAGAKGKAAPRGEEPTTADEEDDEWGEKGPRDYSIVTPDLAPRCPHCAKEMASAEAVICLYCGYNTLLRLQGKTERVVAHTGWEYFKHWMPGLFAVLFIFLQIVFVFWYCLVLPVSGRDKWYSFVDHESMRLWTAVIALFDIWPVGLFAFVRLVLHPTPPDKVKD